MQCHLPYIIVSTSSGDRALHIFLHKSLNTYRTDIYKMHNNYYNQYIPNRGPKVLNPWAHEVLNLPALRLFGVTSVIIFRHLALQLPQSRQVQDFMGPWIQDFLVFYLVCIGYNNYYAFCKYQSGKY